MEIAVLTLGFHGSDSETHNRGMHGVGRGNSGLFPQWGKPMNAAKRYVSVHAWRWCSGLLRTGVMLATSLLTFPDAWALDAVPTMLSFQAMQGGTKPPSQIVNILKNNDRTLSWRSSDNATWVSVSPTTGSLTKTAQISVSVNPTGLTAGSYTATVTVSVNKGGDISVPVTLTVASGSTTSSTSTTQSSSSGTTATAPITMATAATLPGTTPAASVAGAPTGSAPLAGATGVHSAASTVSVPAPVSGGSRSAANVLKNSAITSLVHPATPVVTAPPPSTPPSTPPSSPPASPSTGNATLTWAANVEPNNVAGYKIYVGTNSGTYSFPGSPFVTGKVTSYAISRLPKGQTYYFAISAYNSAGDESELSAEVSKSLY